MDLKVYIALDARQYEQLTCQHRKIGERFPSNTPTHVYLSEKNALDAFIKYEKEDIFEVYILEFIVDKEQCSEDNKPYFEPEFHSGEEIPVTGIWHSVIDIHAEKNKNKYSLTHYHVEKTISWKIEKEID
ncbi:MAG: hypothetical protein IKJ01_06420 [Lachnospiraceae bacterium]|nr:hypothetical protein [Lachnospiraceae bacterium]